jgi:hypothetical protein
MNLCEDFRRDGFREIDARHLCAKSWRKLLDLDIVKFKIIGMRHFHINEELDTIVVQHLPRAAVCLYVLRLMKRRVGDKQQCQ